MKQLVKGGFLFLIIALMTASCSTLKPYERVYVDDAEMQMGGSQHKKFLQYMQSIREGAVPAQGLKGSGGCGCN